MTESLRIACAQLNPVLGDISGNQALARETLAKAQKSSADLVVFSELFISGYPPEDLILKPAFVDASMAAIQHLAEATANSPAALVGTPWREDNAVYNAVALLANGTIQTLRYKVDLPNYSVFDEKRVFKAGRLPGPINFKGVRLGVPICEDIWTPDVCETLAESGAEILIVPNGSPFTRTKREQRLNMAVARVVETGLPLLYVNQVGGQDELVFDGASFALNQGAHLAMQMPAWETGFHLTEWKHGDNGWACQQGNGVDGLAEGDEAVYMACMIGLRDYVEKNGFPGVVLGLSGGVDSALCAAIAVDALGPSRVHCVMLPYRYTSNASLADAANCARALGVRYDIVPIAPAVEGFEAQLATLFKTTRPDLTEENIQSRVRGTTLMAISNKFGSMVVTTGNKSEVSVGYATLYGDMNGGFNPIKDLYKTQVYALCRFRNTLRPKGCLGPEGVIIPETVIAKAPTAELRENQTDQDSLPPYDVLDDVLEALVDREQPLANIIAQGHAPETVKKIEKLLYLSEYKRRQSAPGVKITERNFGRDRRYPIVNRFRET